MPPGSADLLLWAAAGGGWGLLALLLAARRRRAPGARRLLTLADALGDAALLLGRERVAGRNRAARRLLGASATRGHRVATDPLLGPQLTALRQGLDRGPASGAFALGGGTRAEGLLLRLSSRPVRELLVLRVQRTAGPPPLPALAPPATPARRERVHADLTAIAASLRTPASRAATSAALLRLALPAPPPAVSAELSALETAVAELERRLAALRSAGGAGAGVPHAVDLAALLRDLAPERARLVLRLDDGLGARALVDEARLRAGLREVLRAAQGSAGGEVAVRAGTSGADAVLELSWAAGAGAEPEDAAALARALLGPEGARVEVEARPGRGRTCRILLPAAGPPQAVPGSAARVEVPTARGGL